MVLKRNVLTILYSFIFIVIMGIGFAQIMYLAISSSQDRNVIACIIILGIIIYLILAFLMKEGRKAQFLQTAIPVLQIAEAAFALLVIAGAFLLNLESGIQSGISSVLLLVVLYGCGRLLGGRLCAVLSLCTGFFFFFVLASADYETDHTLDILCFLVCYFVFLLITKKLTAFYVQQPFLIVVSYMMLAVLFVLSMILNPLTVFLLLGCFFALLTGKTGEKGTIFTSGPFLALILLLFSAAIFAGVYFLMPDLIQPMTFDMDLSLKQMDLLSVDTGRYMLNKYLQAGNLLYLTTQTGIFPAILYFFAGLSGYYAIRRKASAVTPLCLAYLGTLTYHLVFLGSQNEFYYMFYFLPLFSAYGIYNTLIPEETENQAEEKEESDDPVEESADSVAESGGTAGAMETGSGTEKIEPASDDKEEVLLKSARKERVPKEKKSKEKQSQKKKQPEKPVSEPEAPVLQPTVSDVQEWTVSDKYLSSYQEEKETPKKAASVPEVNISIPEIALPDVSEPLISEPLVTEPLAAEPVITEPAISEAVVSEPDISEPVISLQDTQEPVQSGQVMLEPDSQFSDITESGLMEFDDQDDLQLIQEEPAVVNPVRLPDPSEDIAVKQEDPSLLSTDNLKAEAHNDGKGESIEFSAEFDNDADAQLNTLLNRLDISDNIRRMNESAREDIADIIERDDTENELHEAKPAEELDFEMPEKQEEKTHEPLPRYVKPDFDITIEPLSQPLTDSEDRISEYDKVPTINDLEKKWRDVNESPKAEEETSAAQYSFAYSLEDVAEAVSDAPSQTEKAEVHSEEIVRKNGMGKRSYHKLTIR